MTYEAKTLFSGYKLGLNNKNLYVGVPDKYFDEEGEIWVRHGNRLRRYNRSQIVESREFPDKYTKGSYILNYYLWLKR